MFQSNLDKVQRRNLKRNDPVYLCVTSKRYKEEEEVFNAICQVAHEARVKTPAVSFDIQNGQLFAVFRDIEKYPTGFIKKVAKILSDND